MYATTVSRVTYFLLRVVGGLLFFCHGAQKVLGAFGGLDAMGGTVPVQSLLGVGGTLELIGGACIVLGLFTRPVAFVLAGEMAVAYFLQHAAHGFWPIANHGELALLYSFLFLFFAAHGSGAYGADVALRTRKAVR